MKLWLQREFKNLIFWLSVISAIAAIAYGYSEIRSSQVRVEEKCASFDFRLVAVESRLDKLLDIQLRQGADVGPAQVPLRPIPAYDTPSRRRAPAAQEGSVRAYRIANQNQP